MSVLITEMRKNDLVDGGNQVDQAEKSYAAKKIVLSGFSQGAAISLVTGLTGEFEFAGIASLSGFLPLKNKLDSVCRFRFLCSSTSLFDFSGALADERTQLDHDWIRKSTISSHLLGSRVN